MKQPPQAPSRYHTNSLGPLLFTLAILVVVGFVYAAAQQQYRQAANDPQIEWAGDLAADMSAGSLAQDAVGPYARDVNPSSSLATFAVITDAHGKVLTGNLKMDGTTPLPPKGVLAASSISHQNRITWQPERGTRIALVVQAY